jgi:hypothetical protein
VGLLGELDCVIAITLEARQAPVFARGVHVEYGTCVHF